MKKILLLFSLLLLLFNCTPQKAEIINNYYDLSLRQFVDCQVFPEQEFRGSKSYSVQIPSDDWQDGIIYKENAKSFDSVIHELDLGYLTGGKRALVYLEVSVIEHGYDYFRSQYDDSAGLIYIREKNSLANFQSVIPKYNQSIDTLLVLTDSTGKIEWYHEHNTNYWDNPTCEPGNEIYKWEKIVITCRWLVN